MSTNNQRQRRLSPRAVAALDHLRLVRPFDGYAVESYLSLTGKTLVRLKRRNIPLKDEGFLDICVHKSRVIGIQVLTSSGDVGRGIILVNEDGTPCSAVGSSITVNMTKVLTSNSASSNKRTSNDYNAPTNPLPIFEHENIVQYGIMAFGGILILNILLNALSSLVYLVLPLFYFYACNNCPSAESFDAKKELKRVMRGAHLPEEHQPKGWLEGQVNRLAASISTELATSLGYEVRVTDYFGAAKLSAVKVPVAGLEYYWIGVANRWLFVGQREMRRSDD